MSLKTLIQTAVSRFSGKEKAFFLILTVVAGIFILWPLHNFQHYLAQGDHGRDLYCFKKTMEGALPYRDFSWLFGPLMPYYYSLSYILNGVSIQSVLLGQNILILLAGVFVYLSCSVFLPPSLSFVCAFWYWSFRGTEFFYTYNHIGGLVALLAALYCIFQYIRQNRRVYIYGGFISSFLLMLIRLWSILIPFCTPYPMGQYTPASCGSFQIRAQAFSKQTQTRQPALPSRRNCPSRRGNCFPTV